LYSWKEVVNTVLQGGYHKTILEFYCEIIPALHMERSLYKNFNFHVFQQCGGCTSFQFLLHSYYSPQQSSYLLSCTYKYEAGKASNLLSGSGGQ